MTQQGIVYEGNIHAQRYVAGVLQDLAVGPLEITGFTIKPANEIKERRSNLVRQSGKIRGTMGRTAPTEIKITANAADADIYALFMAATTSALSVTGSTVTGESRTMSYDKWYKLDHENVSSVAIATKTEGVDFQVDAILGAILILSTGTIADGATSSIDYTYGSITGTTINVGKEAKVDVKIVGRLVNSETGNDAFIKIPKVTLTLSKELNLIGDDYSDFEVTGKCILLDGETADCYLSDPVTYA